MARHKLSRVQQLSKIAKQEYLIQRALVALRQNNGNRTNAAEQLGYKRKSRMGLYRVMKQSKAIANEFPMNPPPYRRPKKLP